MSQFTRQRTWLAWIGGAWLVFLLLAYFIPLTVEEGDNYVVRGTLLGALIMHNLWLLALFIAAGIALLWLGVRLRVKFV